MSGCEDNLRVDACRLVTSGHAAYWIDDKLNREGFGGEAGSGGRYDGRQPTVNCYINMTGMSYSTSREIIRECSLWYVRSHPI